jgi:hypothetical protein
MFIWFYKDTCCSLTVLFQLSIHHIPEVLEQPACTIHCPEGSIMYAEAVNNCMLPNVMMTIKMFGPQVHSLLQSHDGNMPLMR